MGKRTQRRSVLYEKDQSGCMWGLISLLDFRRGRTTQKLLSDTRRSNRHADSVYSKNKYEMLSSLDEDSQEISENRESKIPAAVKSDSDKPSVKKLMEEEIFAENDMKKEISNAQISKESRLGCKSAPRKKKSHKKSSDMDSNDLNSVVTSKVSCNQQSRQLSVNKIDLIKIMEEFCQQMHHRSTSSMNHGLEGKVDMHLNEKQCNSEESVGDTMKEFVDQMIFKVENLAQDGKLDHSNNLMTALQIITSDKELFPKLLEDPKSVLLKYVQESQDAQVEKDFEYSSTTVKMLEQHQLGGLGEDKEIVNRKQRKFFGKKLKSQVKISTKGNETWEASNKIVILKPGPKPSQNFENGSHFVPSSDSDHINVKHNTISNRSGSYLFFTEIKRKLKHVIGKEKHPVTGGVSWEVPVEHQKVRGKVKDKEKIGRMSPNKDHFFIEKIARPSIDVKRGDKAQIPEESETLVECGSGEYPRQRVSEIYIDARKHPCKMLDIGVEDADSSSRQVDPKTLGRILSLPEYVFSPMGSPRRDLDQGFVTSQTRLSAYDKFQKINENVWSPKQATNINHLDNATLNFEKQPIISDETLDSKVQPLNANMNCSNDFTNDDKVEEIFFPIEYEITPEGNVGIVEDIDVQDFPSTIGNSSASGKDQDSDISDDRMNSECLNQDISEENQHPSSPVSTPSQSSVAKKAKELDCSNDTQGKPSPVSVLEPPFTEDKVSPANMSFRPVQLPIQPLQIPFEEHASELADQFSCQKQPVGENELIFDYIKAVLQASGLNWDKFWHMFLSSDQILDPVLFDQVEFFNDKIPHDHRLLFDCINEALMEVCQHYFGASSFLSFVKPGIRPVPNMRKVFREVCQGVSWHLLQSPMPRTLDQTVRKDMERSDAWMDLRSDAETVGSEMGESILTELLEDTLLSCMTGHPDSRFAEIESELKVKEDIIDL